MMRRETILGFAACVVVSMLLNCTDVNSGYSDRTIPTYPIYTHSAGANHLEAVDMSDWKMEKRLEEMERRIKDHEGRLLLLESR
jgi:hypothetical protein